MTTSRRAADRLVRWVAFRVHGGHLRLFLYLILGLTVAAASLAGLIGLGRIVTAGTTLRVDDAILDWVGGLRTPERTRVMLELSALGSADALLPVLIVATLVLLAAGRRLSALLVWVAVGGGHLLNWTLKSVYARPRPEVVPWETAVGSASFPSGHALSSLIAYGAVSIFIGRLLPWRAARLALWTGAFALTLAVGISRIYLGVHYPTDVVAGFAVGLAWLAIVASALPAARLFASAS